MSKKQYGLILSKKEAPKPCAKPIAVFNNSSDEDDDSTFKNMVVDPKKETMMAVMKKNTKINFDKALAEDPSVFEYDEVYDEISSEKKKQDDQKHTKKNVQPKYINKLLKVSAVRKLETELLQERKAQKELEREQDKFSDQESYVTPAYKARMAEIREMVEKRQEDDQRDELMDVTKQDGIGGFYRYMYDKQCGRVKDSVPSESPAEETSPPKPTDKPSSSHKNRSISRDKEDRDRDRNRRPDRSSCKSDKPSAPPIPAGFVKAKPRATSDKELAAILERYKQRVLSGQCRPVICAADV